LYLNLKLRLGGKVIKKTPVIVLITLFVMLIIPTMAFITLRSASVQTYLASRAAAYLSQELDANVSVGGVNISLFLHIVLEEVVVMDQQNAPLINSKKIILDIKRLSPSKRILEVNKVLFDESSVSFIKHVGDNEFNYQFLINYFDRKEKPDSTDKKKWHVTVKSFEFENASISSANPNEELTGFGFDPNHFSFHNLDIRVEDIYFKNDTLKASLKEFSANESNGFSLSSFSAGLFFSPKSSRINDLQFISDASFMSMNIDLEHDGYESFKNPTEEVMLQITLNPSRLSFYELSYFFPRLQGIDGDVAINGNLSGTIDNLRGKDINLQYGMFTQFLGNFTLVGLPVIEDTFINFSIERLVTRKSDLETIKFPVTSRNSHLRLPDEFQKLGITSFKGNFTGFLHDFVAFGRFNTALGSISTDIAILSNPDSQHIKYIGNISTKDFMLNKILGDESSFGKVSFSTHIEGMGYNLNNLNVSVSGQIQSLEFRNYDYQQLKVEGNLTNRVFNGNFLVDDPNLYLDFGGVIDLKEKIPLLNFTAVIENANLTELNIYQRDSVYNSYISTTIQVDGQGTNLANVEGEINAYSTSYFETLKTAEDSLHYNQIQTDVIALENLVMEDGSKELRIYSDFIDIQLEGEMNYDKVVGSINKFLYTYAPSKFKKLPEENSDSNTNQIAEIKIHIKNTNDITNLFLPYLEIAPHTYFTGNINTKTNDFALQGTSDFIQVQGNMLQDPEISILSNSNHLELIVRGHKFFITDSIWMEQFFTSILISQDTLTMLTQWENHSSDNKNLGSIKMQGVILSPSKSDFSFMPSYAFINDSLWSISSNNTISIDSSSVNIYNFHLYKKNEYLMINGALSANPNEQLDIMFNNFNLESLSFLLSDRKVDFSGIASGELKLANLRNAPNITTELLIKQFAFNRDHLGDLSLRSKWDSRQKAFKINAEVIYHGNVGSNKPIIANGYFYPERENQNFDIDIAIENLKMSIFGRYIKDFASNFKGLASGKLRLEGPTNAPELSGKARLVRTGFRIDYLNTSYSFAHEIEVGKNFFKIDNLILNDTLGNSARVSGIVHHNNFYNFEVDISLLPENMVVLNTQPYHNELFYGTAFATGFVRVHGKVNDIVIDVSATSNRGTQIFLPLDYSGEITESSFISFVSLNQTNEGNTPFVIPKGFGLSLNFDLTITPEAEVQMIFDSKIGDIMRGRGFGDLRLEIDKQGSFFMYGDYMVQEGDYLFTLQNLINKRFRMEQGGTIRWKGDPYDADIDVRALYRLRTSLFDLAANQSDTSDIYRRRVPIETVLHLQNKLFNPSISFEIQLPGGDETTRDMIERLISTEQEMNRQVFSLLILNRFVPPEDGFNSALSYGMGSTSTELLSNQLSNWLSQISSDFDIGINYRPGDEISSQEVELALSTQLFDDRVVIDGNLGVAGDHPAQTQRTSNIIGDVNVEVKITPEGKFRVKAFNRSNTFDLLNTNAPYTQGIGVFYRKEFDNLSELFNRKKRIDEDIPEIDDIETSLPE
jgi:hypothetical protein